MKKIKIVLKICKYILIGILSVLLLLNIIGVIKRTFFDHQMPLVFGYGNAVIISGSMEPAIERGDIVIIRRQKDYNTGDIVTFKSNNYITHRIVEKTLSGYITRGDANNTDDPEIEYSEIVGKVIKIIPKAGNVVLLLQDPLYMLILFLFLFVTLELPKWLRK